MKSKSLKFMCVNIGLLALTHTLVNCINIIATYSYKPVEEEKQPIGFKGD